MKCKNCAYKSLCEHTTSDAEMDCYFEKTFQQPTLSKDQIDMLSKAYKESEWKTFRRNTAKLVLAGLIIAWKDNDVIPSELSRKALQITDALVNDLKKQETE